MSLEKADALVIRQVDFSESSRVVTFFSREFGKFAALAKGAKRLKGPFDAALDLLSACRVVFIRKSSGTLGSRVVALIDSGVGPAHAPSVKRKGQSARTKTEGGLIGNESPGTPPPASRNSETCKLLHMKAL